MWVPASEDDLTCAITEAGSAEPVALREESGDLQRDAGAVPYQARFSGRAETSQVDVVCPARPQASPIHVDEVHRPVFLDFLGPWAVLPLVLAALGLLLLVLAPLRRLRR
ncbi:MAG TPA: hypothetical protein VNS46_04130 [Nocardioides sp.]|nr:hypothetical protein [Nocardioides sp.]